MGESKRKQRAALAESALGGDTSQVVDTLGGRMHVRWDRGAAATPHGQLVFFAEFLAATGVFERWVSECPLAYRSGNAPDKRDVLGTLMRVCWLGTAKLVSEDALRRALGRMDEAASAAWMRPALMHSVREALDRPLRSWSPLCDVLPFTRWRPAPTGDRHPPSRSPGASSWNRVESEA